MKLQELSKEEQMEIFGGVLKYNLNSLFLLRLSE